MGVFRARGIPLRRSLGREGEAARTKPMILFGAAGQISSAPSRISQSRRTTIIAIVRVEAIV